MSNAHATYHAWNNSDFIKAAKISGKFGDPGVTQTNFNSNSLVDDSAEELNGEKSRQ